jgi:hypothetical protein
VLLLAQKPNTVMMLKRYVKVVTEIVAIVTVQMMINVLLVVT